MHYEKKQDMGGCVDSNSQKSPTLIEIIDLTTNLVSRSNTFNKELQTLFSIMKYGPTAPSNMPEEDPKPIKPRDEFYTLELMDYNLKETLEILNINLELINKFREEFVGV